MDIKVKVNSLIAKFETDCPFELAKRLGVHIQYEYLGNILGYYSKHFRIPIIHINESAEELQQVFICGHELGHHVLHLGSNTSFLNRHTFFSTSKIEVEAHTFSIELIFANKKIVTYDDIEEYGIPKQLALLKSLGE